MRSMELSYLAYADFFHQLAVLLRSGIRTSDGLYILAEEEKNAAYRKMLTEMSQKMDEGVPLSSALADAGCFPSYAIGLIETAERVGRTEETLLTLSDYYENRDRIRKSLKNALTYPSVMLLMMLVVITVLLIKVLPIFDDVYASLGGSLTGLAGGLLKLGGILDLLMPFFGILLGFLLIIAAMILLIPSLNDAAKKASNRIFGDRGIMRKINNTYFVQSLSIGMASGLPLDEAISLAINMFKDTPAAGQRFCACKKQLDDGVDLVSVLQTAGILDASAAQLLKVSIRAGSADITITQISSRMSDQTEEMLESMVAKIEPAMVIVTSVMVGAILLSVMLPLINIMKAIG
ncbi:MAG: type II secretion system F family protein [Clostridia bacterium]|nr:type II secretion system F family protein [Clostridia bacterium]